LKTKLKDEEFETMEGRVEELLGQLTADTTQQVYGHLIERLNQMIHIDGDDVERQLS
jgi:hypothetical protein